MARGRAARWLATQQPGREGDSAGVTGGGGGTAPSDRTSGSGTALDRRSAPPAGELERRVAETLSRLGAQERGGDTVVTLPDRVLFDFDEHVLRPEAPAVLDELVEVLGFFEDAPVAVQGHTDWLGTPAYNQQLSERRAHAVVDYFTSAGVDAARITPRGFGEEQPVAPNAHPDGSDDPDGRARNRRVEIILEGADLDALPA